LCSVVIEGSTRIYRFAAVEMGVCFSGSGKEDGGGGGGGGGTDAKAKRTRPAPRAETAILFFPDVALPCHAHFHTLFPQTKAAGCRRGASCKYAHERTGLVVLLQTLYSARRTLDVCVYVRPSVCPSQCYGGRRLRVSRVPFYSSVKHGWSRTGGRKNEMICLVCLFPCVYGCVCGDVWR